jgi:hypothetical protein
MSSLSDKLGQLDVNEHLIVDVLDGTNFKNASMFKKTVEAKAYTFMSRVTNKQRLHKRLQDRKFAARAIQGVQMDDEGNLLKLVKVTRLA